MVVGFLRRSKSRNDLALAIQNHFMPVKHILCEESSDWEQQDAGRTPASRSLSNKPFQSHHTHSELRRC